MAREKQQLYEEHKELGSLGSWVIIIAYSAGILLFGLLIYFKVEDRPREWDYHALPDAPAESIYSIYGPPGEKSPPRQVAPLPETDARRDDAPDLPPQEKREGP